LIPVPSAPSVWDEEEHVQRLLELPKGTGPKIITSAGRGSARQMQKRQREHLLREHVVSFKDWMEELGLSRLQAAALLNLSPHTLRQWEYQHRRSCPLVLPLGRPARCSTPQQRNAVIALLDELGPAIGVPTLQAFFPDMARAELEDIVHRYRRVWRKRNYRPLCVLDWQVPGSVWAADFTGPLKPIDDLYPYLLAVRDLASGYQLLWLPVMRPDSAEVAQALASLVTLHGAPLVLKTDNGSPFSAALYPWPSSPNLPAFVQMLFSPPYTPAYNGSVEAGICSLKTRTQAHASRHGHPGSWSFDDVAAAQQEANATARPRGHSQPTPDQAWQDRRAIPDQQRTRFHNAVQHQRELLRADPDFTDFPKVGPLNVPQQRALDRHAIRRALVELGFLLFQRRRIPLPFTTKKVTGIT
jgi:hypothetical protein